jgi:hypothetical protein
VFILDDILLLPLRGIHWVAREIHNAAHQELDHEADAITAELSDLYRMLEAGKITEAEFGAREKTLLDRLDKIEGRGTEIEGEDLEAEGQVSEPGVPVKQEEHAKTQFPA